MRSGSLDITEQASLAQSRLSAITEASDDAIITQSLNGAIVSWSSGAEHMYGYPSDAMIGRPISILVPPGLPDVMPDVLQRIAQGAHVGRFDTVHATSTGVEIDVSITASPLRAPSGKVIGFATIARDVTERRAVELALHETERKYRTIFENVREGIFYVTADGEIVAANPALVRLLGYDSAEEYIADPDHLPGRWTTSSKPGGTCCSSSTSPSTSRASSRAGWPSHSNRCESATWPRTPWISSVRLPNNGGSRSVWPSTTPTAT